MKKIIFYSPNEAGKLCCDTPSCGYEEPEGQPFTRQLIGKPCPNCGASMLSQHEFDRTTRIFRAVDWLNKYFGWLGREQPPADAAAVTVKVRGDETIIRRKYNPKK